MEKHHRSRCYGDRMSRSVSVPKGFLRYSVLKLLNYMPMSGSELMERVERRTGWRPSPGSIYPLLSKMRGEGFIKEVESKEDYLKRFMLTEKGKKLLKEYDERRIFRKKIRSIRGMWLKICMEMDDDLYQSSMRLFESIERIYLHLRKGEAKELAGKLRSIIIRVADDIEKLHRDLEIKEG